mmetsp:Transcript_14729/g.35056  ORF Transcript_14729/g.35056 Transcript_14729/m.35056 type:complete len:453 (-) Transcript_14729:1466-2824(-)
MASVSSHPPTGPVTVYTEDSNFRLYFPWELNNTDYLRRILASLTFALRPLYRESVASGCLAKARNWHGGEIEPDDLDAYYALKHVDSNLPYYSCLLGLDEEALKETISWLLRVRNDLAHENLAGVAKHTLERAFSNIERLVFKSGCQHIERNLQRLKRQWDDHEESKRKRMQQAHAGNFLLLETFCPSFVEPTWTPARNGDSKHFLLQGMTNQSQQRRQRRTFRGRLRTHRRVSRNALLQRDLASLSQSLPRGLAVRGGAPVLLGTPAGPPGRSAQGCTPPGSVQDLARRNLPNNRARQRGAARMILGTLTGPPGRSARGCGPPGSAQKARDGAPPKRAPWAATAERMRLSLRAATPRHVCKSRRPPRGSLLPLPSSTTEDGRQSNSAAPLLLTTSQSSHEEDALCPRFKRRCGGARGRRRRLKRRVRRFGACASATRTTKRRRGGSASSRT